MQRCTSLLNPPCLMDHAGHVNNVGEWIGDPHVFVFPSFYREGIPHSTQEAMAMGRAVITTDVLGCRKTVVHGENGFFVPLCNAEALADAIESVLISGQQADREKRCMLARKRIEDQFSIQPMVSTYVELWNEVVA